MQKISERVVSAAEPTNCTSPDISQFNMKDFVGSLTAEQRERALSLSPSLSSIRVLALGMSSRFKKKKLEMLPAPDKLPGMGLTNIAFRHPKLSLNIKPTGKHLLMEQLRKEG